MKPSLGRIVIVRDVIGESPGIVTRVHSDTNINARVFTDSEDNPPLRTSLPLIAPDSADVYGWFWPPKV